MNKNIKNLLIFIIIIASIFPGCVKKSKLAENRDLQDTQLLPYEKRLLLEEEKQKETKKIKKTKHKSELDFDVENKTGKTIYVVCFSYINKTSFDRWRWDKSPIYKLEKNQKATIDIDTIPDKEYKNHVYGALGIFNTQEEAESSTYELLKEKHRLDLDKLYKLKDKTVEIKIEKYGFKGDTLDLKITPKKNNFRELDFFVENKTGKNLWICCFVYQKDDTPIWKFDKTNLQLIKDGEIKIIDVDTIANKYNRVFTSGFLGVFDEKNKTKAEKSTYELLQPKNKIALGKLAALKNKIVVIKIEKYGFKDDFLEIAIKPTKRIYK
ncbi:hypothetical protein GF385_04190 [Candidatus Dependentiae bacterium]|nr:hypothetical protein [Candidatus Dependentiae bacterium]